MKQADRLILAARIFDAVYQMTLMQEKDNNPDHWKTINGAHVHVDENGNYDGGAGGLFNGKHHYGKGYKEKAEKDRQKALKNKLKAKRDKINAEKAAEEDKEKENKDRVREILKKHWNRTEYGKDYRGRPVKMTEEALEKAVNRHYSYFYPENENDAYGYQMKKARESMYRNWEYDAYLEKTEKRLAKRREIAAEVEEARMKMLKKRIKRDNPKIAKKELESRAKEEYDRMFPGGVTKEDIDLRMDEPF